jgi:hypothetical protein
MNRVSEAADGMKPLTPGTREEDCLAATELWYDGIKRKGIFGSFTNSLLCRHVCEDGEFG